MILCLEIKLFIPWICTFRIRTRKSLLCYNKRCMITAYRKMCKSVGNCAVSVKLAVTQRTVQDLVIAWGGSARELSHMQLSYHRFFTRTCINHGGTDLLRCCHNKRVDTRSNNQCALGIVQFIMITKQIIRIINQFVLYNRLKFTTIHMGFSLLFLCENYYRESL